MSETSGDAFIILNMNIKIYFLFVVFISETLVERFKYWSVSVDLWAVVKQKKNHKMNKTVDWTENNKHPCKWLMKQCSQLYNISCIRYKKPNVEPLYTEAYHENVMLGRINESIQCGSNICFVLWTVFTKRFIFYATFK